MVTRIENVATEELVHVSYTMLEVPIERIRPCPYQPRKYFDPEEERARAESIRAVGQQEAATVDKVSDDPNHDYEIVNGESRWRSAIRAGQKTLWVAIRSEPFGSKREKHLAAFRFNAGKNDSREGRNIPWERAPEPLTDRLPREVFHKRLDEWHDFWLSLFPPETKVTHRTLLLEIAYPKLQCTGGV